MDDEDLLRGMARRFLESNGYRVIEARDGAEALHMLEGMPELPRVLMTDLIMPRLDGPALIRALREKHPALKVIAMGGLPPSSEVLEQLGLARQHFIAKPFDSAALLNALRDVLA